MATLTATLQELAEHRREAEWRAAGVGEDDIRSSRLTGMDARDIGTFRRFSRRALLFVVRCPKTSARAHHGVFPPKTCSVKDKTGSSGLVVARTGRIMVSDYDLMCVWRQAGADWRKVFMSAADGADRGPWPRESQALMVELNQQLVSRLQHGCQDDYRSPKNPGVKAEDHFAAIVGDTVQHLVGPDACAGFYRRLGLPWPYGTSGRMQLG